MEEKFRHPRMIQIHVARRQNVYRDGAGSPLEPPKTMLRERGWSLRMENKFRRPITLHDPANIVFGRGVGRGLLRPQGATAAHNTEVVVLLVWLLSELFFHQLYGIQVVQPVSAHAVCHGPKFARAASVL